MTTAQIEQSELRDAASAMLAALKEELAAGDALTAFLIAPIPKAMSETAWSAEHTERSQRRRNAISACRAAVAFAERAGIHA